MTSETHLIKWDLSVMRNWHPYYYLTGGRTDPEPVPPFQVNFSCEFDDNDSAVLFEGRVRKILEDMS
jgi:hypothetical protein